MRHMSKKIMKGWAYTEGVYALCRHPGVLWFAGFYFCLAGFLGSGKALRAFGILIVWNILYIFLPGQDRVSGNIQ